MRVHYTVLCLAIVSLLVPGAPETVQAAPLSSGGILGSLPDSTVELVARRHAFRGGFRGGGVRGGFAGRRMGGYGRVGRPGFAGGGVQRRGIAGGYARRGGVVVRRNVVVGGVFRPRGAWWPAGGALAAGAAIGFVGAATAAAWAGAPPAPGYCWFYTDSSRTQGFWDRCPA